MKRPLCAVAVLATLVFPAGVRAETGSATRYYLSLGDSLAASFQPNLDVKHGYAEQLYAALATGDPKLELVKLGCGGESTVSFVGGLTGGCQPWFLCPNTAYPHGTQLAEAVNFLHAHKDNVALVTIDLGGNDVLPCFAAADPGCFEAALTEIKTRLPQILTALRAAAAAGVPIVGMTYYDVYAPVCLKDPSRAFICNEVDALNTTLAGIYALAGARAADVAGAFDNNDLLQAKEHVCARTWFCALGDVHANTAGYGVIAQAFEEAIP
jgi:lysophospholipase L1-like esterase